MHYEAAAQQVGLSQREMLIVPADIAGAEAEFQFVVVAAVHDDHDVAWHNSGFESSELMVVAVGQALHHYFHSLELLLPVLQLHPMVVTVALTLLMSFARATMESVFYRD